MITGHNFTYLHVPRNGGFSIAACIRASGVMCIESKNLHSLPKNSKKTIIGFKRDPLDRLISIYEALKTMPFPDKLVTETKEKTWEQWVPWARDNQVHMFIRPQKYWLRYCTLIGDFHNLTASWKEICDMINIPFIIPNKLNSVKRQNTYEYYKDTEIKDAAMELIKDDLDYLIDIQV